MYLPNAVGRMARPVVALMCAAVLALASHAKQLVAAGASLSVLHVFPSADNSGYLPQGLIEGSDGNFYGVTRFGGGKACGTVYRLTPAGSMAQLHVFKDENDGCQPVGRLLEGLDGMLYGVASDGTSTLGTVFRLDPDGSDFEVLKSFTASVTQGAHPVGSLVQGSDGSIYGTTGSGGASGAGVVFKMDPDGSAFSVLHSFETVASGTTTTQAGLLLASDGLLYGTLSSGTAENGGGGVFRVGTDGTGYALIHQNAGNVTGIQSDAPLIEGTDGKLYGTGFRYTYAGSCGSGCSSYTVTHVVFGMNKDGTGKSEIHTFADTRPSGGLMLALDGNLYGVATVLSSNLAGGVYRLATNGTGYAELHTFGVGDDGYGPTGQLVQAGDGNFYGATVRGGNANDAGTVFSLTPAGAEAVLHAFGSDFDGFEPVAGVTVGSDGVLYGATKHGGAPLFETDITGARGSEGAVFKLGTDGGGFALLHSFSFANSDGNYPLGTPVEGLDGALYGTTWQGGTISSAGTVYRITTAGSESLVHSFASGAGRFPQSGVVVGTDGTLYGTAEYGGSGGLNGRGVVYRVQPDGTSYTVLREFAGGAGDGQYPAGAPVLGADARLYGTTTSGGGTGCGGGGCGTIFGIDTDGANYATVYAFAGGDDGAAPMAALLEAGDGFLYGTTSRGGGTGCAGNGCGTVFRVRPDGSGYAVLHAFAGGLDGATPVAALAEAADGTLYGTTRHGGGTGCGGDGCGIVFRLAPSGAYGVAYAFAGETDGADPRAGLTPGPGDVFYGTASRGGSFLDGGTVFKLQDTPTFLPAPTGLTATAGDEQASLDWTASAGAATYDVYQGTVAGGESPVAVATGITGTTATITGLVNGTEYFFVVRAAAGTDRSAPSNEASTQPVGAPDVTLVVAPASIRVGESAQLSWTTAEATSCTASNAWAGGQALQGTQAVSPASPGTYTYVLSCAGPGGTTEDNAILEVTPVPAGGGGGGGGAMGLGALLMLLLAGRRRAPAARGQSRTWIVPPQLWKQMR